MLSLLAFHAHHLHAHHGGGAIHISGLTWFLLGIVAFAVFILRKGIH